MVLEQKLKEFINDCKKLVILSIGNELRGDDGLGPVISRELSPIFNDKRNLKILDGGVVPENFTGAIRKENPTHVILLDAVDMGENPGHIRVIETEEIANYNISTHAMPLSFLIKYLQSTMDVEIILVGIQPKEMDMALNISEEVQKSVDKLVNLFTVLFSSFE